MSEQTTPAPDPRVIERAEAAVAAASRTLARAETKAAALADVLADADDAVSVANTKVEDFREGDAKLPWQVAAAEADLAKKKRAQVRAQARHAAAAEKVTVAEDLLSEARGVLAQARVTPAEPIPDDAGMPPGAPPEVVAWVDKLTRYLESQERDDSMWCPQWQEHPEAVWRFTALQREFEIAFQDDTMSSWWVNHFDRHAPFLFGRTGIFQACETTHASDRTFRFARRA